MKRKIASLYYKLYIKLKEKTYKQLKYIYLHANSNTLIVSFSGFSGGGPAKYNYVKTLHDISAHKLFILDDFGYNKQGSYYLGENGDLFLIELITEFIQNIKIKNKIDQVIMIGSSKGGTAALYYAVKMKADACIIGAPQYHIGDYLSIEKHLPILAGIMGNTDDDSCRKLNNLMYDCISSGYVRKPKVYIHYSPLEHTYSEHIADMINDLEKHGYAVETDADYEYTEHENVAKFFPGYLTKSLGKIIGKKLLT